MEFPKYIQLDFLMVIIGLGVITISIYSMTYREIEEKSYLITFLIFVICGFLLFIFGFYEMIKNYSRDNELKDLQVMMEKKRLEGLLKNEEKNKQSFE